MDVSRTIYSRQSWPQRDVTSPLLWAFWSTTSLLCIGVGCRFLLGCAEEGEGQDTSKAVPCSVGCPKDNVYWLAHIFCFFAFDGIMSSCWRQSPDRSFALCTRFRITYLGLCPPASPVAKFWREHCMYYTSMLVFLLYRCHCEIPTLWVNRRVILLWWCALLAGKSQWQL